MTIGTNHSFVNFLQQIYQPGRSELKITEYYDSFSELAVECGCEVIPNPVIQQYSVFVGEYHKISPDLVSVIFHAVLSEEPIGTLLEVSQYGLYDSVTNNFIQGLVPRIVVSVGLPFPDCTFLVGEHFQTSIEKILSEVFLHKLIMGSSPIEQLEERLGYLYQHINCAEISSDANKLAKFKQIEPTMRAYFNFISNYIDDVSFEFEEKILEQVMSNGAVQCEKLWALFEGDLIPASSTEQNWMLPAIRLNNQLIKAKGRLKLKGQAIFHQNILSLKNGEMTAEQKRLIHRSVSILQQTCLSVSVKDIDSYLELLLEFPKQSKLYESFSEEINGHVLVSDKDNLTEQEKVALSKMPSIKPRIRENREVGEVINIERFGLSDSNKNILIAPVAHVCVSNAFPIKAKKSYIWYERLLDSNSDELLTGFSQTVQFFSALLWKIERINDKPLSEEDVSDGLLISCSNMLKEISIKPLNLEIEGHVNHLLQAYLPERFIIESTQQEIKGLGCAEEGVSLAEVDIWFHSDDSRTQWNLVGISLFSGEVIFMPLGRERLVEKTSLIWRQLKTLVNCYFQEEKITLDLLKSKNILEDLHSQIEIEEGLSYHKHTSQLAEAIECLTVALKPESDTQKKRMLLIQKNLYRCFHQARNNFNLTIAKDVILSTLKLIDEYDALNTDVVSANNTALDDILSLMASLDYNEGELHVLTHKSDLSTELFKPYSIYEQASSKIIAEGKSIGLKNRGVIIIQNGKPECLMPPVIFKSVGPYSELDTLIQFIEKHLPKEQVIGQQPIQAQFKIANNQTLNNVLAIIYIWRIICGHARVSSNDSPGHMNEKINKLLEYSDDDMFVYLLFWRRLNTLCVSLEDTAKDVGLTFENDSHGKIVVTSSKKILKVSLHEPGRPMTTFKIDSRDLISAYISD